MKSLMIGTPFVFDKVSIRESSFKNDYKLIITSNSSGKFVRGDGTGLKFSPSVHGSMGEFFERFTQTRLSHKIKEQNLKAFNINSDEIEEIPLWDVLLIDTNLMETNLHGHWGDSSGTAFHVNSLELLDSAFLEFIERQSFVFNWLTKTPGILINSDDFIGVEKIRKLKSNIQPYFTQISTFEISISRECSVVISVATGKNFKVVSLGADWNVENALYKSLKECWQLVSQYNPSSLELFPSKLLEPYTIKSDYFDNSYHDYFSSLTIDEVKEKYSYLYKNDNEHEHTLIRGERPAYENYNRKLKQIAEELSIEILICYIPSIIEDIPGSVIKLVGKGAFPHIKTDMIDPSLYKINGINKISNIPNERVMVPFS